jgi:hypothetical protein
VERRPSFVIFPVDIGTVCHQKLHHVKIVLDTSLQAWKLSESRDEELQRNHHSPISDGSFQLPRIVNTAAVTQRLHILIVSANSNFN